MTRDLVSVAAKSPDPTQGQLDRGSFKRDWWLVSEKNQINTPLGICFLPCGKTQGETEVSHLGCGLPHRAHGQAAR